MLHVGRIATMASAGRSTPSNPHRPLRNEESHLVPSKSASRKGDLAARQKAKEILRRQEAAERRRKALIWAVIGLLAAGVVAGLVYLRVSTGGGASAGTIAGVKTFPEKAEHVTTPVNYPQTPPAGGPHNPVWLNCGIYDQPVPNENAVHDLEHGAVWITYRSGLAENQVEALKKIVGDRTYVDLSPYPGLPTPIVVSAWGKQLQLQNASDPRLAKFIQAYRQGPQTQEPGAPCTGGVGTPTG
jgi:hypothetical protein